MVLLHDPDWDLLSSYGGLLILATGTIYTGSFGSLPNPKAGEGNNDVDDDELNVTERMSSGDAWLFPVIGSVVLFGLYSLIKYFGTEWINWFLGWYFSIAGIGSVWKSLVSLTKFIVGTTYWKQFDKCSLVFQKGSTSSTLFSWRSPSLLLFPLGMLPSILYSTSSKSALLTDILSLSFSHNALIYLKIDSFKTGCILLLGLFFYDIWWVFGTEVMVEVATQLDVPIKLLWPKSVILSDLNGFTMLGLGDVVIPGTFVALALRYDYHHASKSSFHKPYFYAGLTAYVLGLVTSMTVMHIFGKAQPALLYLSPACILSFLMTAVVRGELGDAWTWSDDPDSATTLAVKKLEVSTAITDFDASNSERSID